MSKSIFALSLLGVILFSAFSDPRAEGDPFICSGSCPQETGGRASAKVVGAARMLSEGSVNVLVIFAGFADEQVEDARAPDYGVSLPTRYFSDHPSSYYLATNNTDRGKFGEFVLEILQKVDPDPSMDFGRFDNDGPDGIPNSGDDDGTVDFLFINLWSAPRNFLIGPATGIASLGLRPDYVTRDRAVPSGSIKIKNAFGSVQKVEGFSYAVGVMAHEFGHALGLPDLYDISRLQDPEQAPEEDSAGIGRWGLMGHGALGWNGNDGPNPFCAWSREELGWINPQKGNLIVVEEALDDVVIGDIETGGVVYKIPLTEEAYPLTGVEYFLVENRQPWGSHYNRNLPKGGLLVWHIASYYGGTNAAENSKLVDLECADGLYLDTGYPGGLRSAPCSGSDNLDFWARDEGYRKSHHGNLGDATDVFDGETYTAFTLHTNPSSEPWRGGFHGACTGVSVRNIRRRGSDMIADFELPKWSGRISGSVTWGREIEVVGDVTVGQGGSLTIRPGTEIRFAPVDGEGGGNDPARCELNVYGKLSIQSRSEHPVVFTSAAQDPKEGDWYGIGLDSGSPRIWGLFKEHVRVDYSERGISWLGHGRPGPAFSRYRVDDRKGGLGNGDGLANPGEYVQIKVDLANWGVQTFHTLEVTVSTDDPFLTPRGKVPSARSGLRRPLGPGVLASTTFSSTIASATPDGHVLLFTLDIRGAFDGGDYVRIDTLRIPVTGSDRIPPFIGNPIITGGRGRIGETYYVHAGDTLTLTAPIRDTGDLSSIVARAISLPDSAVVDSVALYEGGAGQYRPFTGAWVPPDSSDFFFEIVAVDSCGNRAVKRSGLLSVLSPFVQSADVLLYDKYKMLIYYEEALSAHGIPYDRWDHNLYGIPDEATLRLYGGDGAIVWGFSTLTRPSVQEYLRRCLEAGGRLLVSAGQIGVNMTHGGKRRNDFYSECIHAEYVKAIYSSDSERLTGPDEDPITGGLSLSLRPANYESTVPLSPAEAILMDGSGRVAGVRVDTGTYKIVYFGFKLEQIEDAAERKALLGKTLDWLLGTPSASLQHDLALDLVVLPREFSVGTELRPRVRIRNLGMQAERDLSISCTIERSGTEVYAERQTLTHLSSGDTSAVTFRRWMPAEVGPYTFTFEVQHTDDQNPSNNMRTVHTRVTGFREIAASAGAADEGAGCGIALGDYDSDGDLDMYLANRGGPNILYRNDGAGFFSDVAPSAGVDHPGKGRGALFGDHDNDGDLDLYLTNEGPNVLYANNGDGTFSDVTLLAAAGDSGSARNALFGDYDNDGFLDLYVVNADGLNRLYRNNGDGTFSEISRAARVDDEGPGRGAAFGDYDNDGDLDLYVANWDAPNVLYRNERDGTFLDITEVAGVGDVGKGDGVSFGDYDNDGFLDLYVANFGPNVLYRNDGRGGFIDVTADAGVGHEGSGVGATFGDYDNDGLLDLYVANFGPNLLYRNIGDGQFDDVTADAGVGDSEDGFGTVFGDYDGDGDLDLYVANGGTNVLYRNDVCSRGADGGTRYHWLRVKTVGTSSNVSGVGAQVKAIHGACSQMREVRGGSGYCSQSGFPVVFGLREHTYVDSLIVRWPSGTVDVLCSVGADTTLTIVEGSSVEMAIEDGGPVPRTFSLSQNYPNPFNPETSIRYEVAKTGAVRLSLYALTGQLVQTLVDGERPAGSYSVTWDGRDHAGRDVASGVYLCRMTAGGGYRATRKLVLVR